MYINKLFRYFILGIVLIFFVSGSEAQINSVGTPFIKSYSRLDYHAGQQNWMADQTGDGRMYFANNDGLLEFDGLNWNLIPLPEGTNIRSVFVARDGNIYVGGFNEFGYFNADSTGTLVYHSLVDKLSPEDRNFDEIWRIHQTPDGLVFQSFIQMIILNKENVQVVKAPSKFHFSYFVNGQLLLVDMDKGILRYSMGKFFPLIGSEQLLGIEIWAILTYGNKLLFVTAEKGIYIYDGNQLTEWANPAADFLKRNQVYSAINLNENYFAFGTIQNGLLICTIDGVPVQKINRIKGLQNNTILCLKKDKAGNLWLGSDNGIDYLEINSPLSYLSYQHGISAGYTTSLFNEILYLGTNQGVFYKNWEEFLSPAEDKNFSLIEATRGQNWTLQIIDDHLFCGNNNGTYIIQGAEAQKISNIPGGWTFLKLNNFTNRIIAGTYSGLVLFDKTNGSWRFEKKINGFNESARSIEQDIDGSFWISHGFKGVFHVFLDEELDSVKQVEFYNSSNGFNTDFGINVTRIKNEIYFTSSDGLYEYNEKTDSFEKSTLFNDLFQLKSLSKLEEDIRGNIWYFGDNKVGVMRLQEDGGYVNISLPFKQIEGNLIGGFEYVNPIYEQNVFFGASDGFIHYNSSQYKDYQFPISAYINKVSILNPDSVISAGHFRSTNYIPALEFRNNALYFSFAANDFENPGKTEFSTFLEGYDENWTSWEMRHNREFTNLYEGDYTFYVKARNIYGVETDSIQYKFSVKPPWERTYVAYIVYVFLGLVFIGIILLIVRKKIERSKKQEKKRQQENFREREEKMQVKSLEAEKEIIRLRNEKLRAKVITKDKKLANSTLDMIQKNKLLTKIKNDLKIVSSTTSDEDVKNQIHNLSKKINKELDTEKQWEVFETHFENVHEAFLKRLKTTYPELSPTELKLAAYLRLNISSKEIAVLMNISTRGVEISRYRLRKKLSLQRNENLTDFILSF